MLHWLQQGNNKTFSNQTGPEFNRTRFCLFE
jgi:hypothetical protein